MTLQCNFPKWRSI